MESAEELLCKTKIQLQDKNPFWAYLIMSMRYIESPACPTLGVDRDANLYYNPAYVQSLSTELRRSVLVHEILHVILMHLARVHKDWSQEVFQVAADVIVNNLIDKEGFTLDPHWIQATNDKFVFKGRT